MSLTRGRTPKRAEQEVEEEVSIIASNNRRRSKSVTKSKSKITNKKNNEKSTPLRSNSRTRNTTDSKENSNTPNDKNFKNVKSPTSARNRSRSQSKNSTVKFDVPNESKTNKLPENEFNNNIYQLITFVLGTINISYIIQYILFLAKSFASLSPWMFTFEMTDELNLTFYVADEELQETETEDSLYEQLRIQPTAFGYYLRASLWAGYGTMIFNTWSLFSLPKLNLFNSDNNTISATTSTSTTYALIESQQEIFSQYVAVLIHLYLLTQLILNLLLLTPRIVIHMQCWSCTNLQDNSLDESLEALRNMLRSDVWIAGRLLSRVQDGVTVLYLLIFQVILTHLKVSESNIGVYNTLVSLSATGIFMVVLRVTVATLYSISCHDPAVLDEARRRGLSPMDIDFMKTFEYNPPPPTSTDVTNNNNNNALAQTPKRTRSNRLKSLNNNTECSICLLSYEKGERLVVLPCNKNHVFHYDCAVHW